MYGVKKKIFILNTKFRLFSHSSVSLTPELQEMLCQLICFILALGIELPRAVIYVITSMCLGEELPSCPGLGFVHIPWAHTAPQGVL